MKGSTNVNLLPKLKVSKSYEINNERPEDPEEELEDYEDLCRQNESQVRDTRLSSLTLFR